MTDNEIIKALECCSGKGACNNECPGTKVDCEIEKCALDLINRQKTEIDILMRKKETLRDEIAEQQAEIERLRKDNEYLNDCVNTVYNLVKEMVGDTE